MPPLGGEPVTLLGVSRATCERLHAGPIDRQVRMGYLDGTLTLASPSIRRDHLPRSLLAPVAQAFGRKTEGSRAWMAWLRGWLAGLPEA